MADLEPGQVGEELPDGTFAPAPRSDEIENLSDDALEQAIQGEAINLERERREKTVAYMTPKPKPGTKEDAADDGEQASEATSEAEETASEGQERKAETPEDERLREMREELELQRLRAEKLDAEIKRSTYQRDHFAGEIGHLKSLLSKPRSASEDDSPGYQPAQQEEVADEDRRELRDELQSFRKERVKSVVEQTYTNFNANVIPAQISRFETIWGKDAGKDLLQTMERIATTRIPEFADELGGTNPKRAQLAVETILKSALADAQIETITTRREAVQREREAQAEKLKARKQDSDMAGRGRVAPKTSSRAKAPDDLSDEELENAVQRSIIQEVSSRGR